MSLATIATMLYDSTIGQQIRESLIAFPLIEGLHLLSLAFSVGLIFFTDLRLAGLLLRDVPASQILYKLRPFVFFGFALQIFTGILLGVAGATNLVGLPIFWIKIVFILLAGFNVLWFERKWANRISSWDTGEPPAQVKLIAWASFTFWTVVVVAGRLIPYLQTTV